MIPPVVPLKEAIPQLSFTYTFLSPSESNLGLAVPPHRSCLPLDEPDPLHAHWLPERGVAPQLDRMVSTMEAIQATPCEKDCGGFRDEKSRLRPGQEDCLAVVAAYRFGCCRPSQNLETGQNGALTAPSWGQGKACGIGKETIYKAVYQSFRSLACNDLFDFSG
jgi:hypothetical protein